jgi:hypothetical protein
VRGAIAAASTAHAQKPSSRPQEVFAPFWTSEPGWETELQLKNNLASGPPTVTPVLRLATGEETALDPVTIPSNASVSVWVNEELLKRFLQLAQRARLVRIAGLPLHLVQRAQPLRRSSAVAARRPH